MNVAEFVMVLKLVIPGGLVGMKHRLGEMRADGLVPRVLLRTVFKRYMLIN
jgi:hypothetical protein